ncbi:hypothetical protein [Mesorhizobium sp. CAU 1741]|uniref:hypothetical protein n=1 Tax=Mesorhizobium sp. CAU 1741 TaxID=3140366 RepID=UPI00325A5265
MDWNAAIEKNRQALKRVLGVLVAMVGLAGERPVLARYRRAAVLRLLRPAESAARRLVVVLAQTLPVALGPLPRKASRRKRRREAKPSTPSLPLFDRLANPLRPRRPAQSAVPRVSTPGHGAPFRITPRLAPRPGDPVDATRIVQRLHALAAALDDLPAQARRMALWQARRARAASDQRGSAGAGRRRRFRRIAALRPGRPPGSHRPRSGLGPRGEVHDILAATHDLAVWALERRDTS